MNELKKTSEKIFLDIVEIEELTKCLCQTIDLCGRDDVKNCGHLLPLAEIILKKCENLSYSYDKLDLSISGI